MKNEFYNLKYRLMLRDGSTPEEVEQELLMAELKKDFTRPEYTEAIQKLLDRNRDDTK